MKFKEGDLVKYMYDDKLIRGIIEMVYQRKWTDPLPPINGSSTQYVVRIPSKIWYGYVVWYKNVIVREYNLSLDIQEIRNKRLNKLLK